MTRDDLIELTTQIVTSHVENNRINVSDVPTLIQVGHDTLAGLDSPPPQVEEPQQPAVSILASVRPDAITCLECGSKQKMIKRHLGTAHDLTADAYRRKWKLSSDYPLVAPDYAAERSAIALNWASAGKRR